MQAKIRILVTDKEGKNKAIPVNKNIVLIILLDIMTITLYNSIIGVPFHLCSFVFKLLYVGYSHLLLFRSYSLLMLMLHVVHLSQMLYRPTLCDFP